MHQRANHPIFLSVLIFIFYGVSAYHPGWRRVQGTLHVLSTEYVRSPGRAGWTTIAVTQYEYEVNGTPYSGDRFAYPATSLAASRVEKYIKEYGNSGSVPVYYDPDDPSRAALWNRPLAHHVVHWLVGPVGVILCILMWKKYVHNAFAFVKSHVSV